MHIRELHAWPTNQGDAVKIQHRFKDDIVLDEPLNRIRLVAGVDTAFDHIANILYAAVNLYSFPELKPLERVSASASAAFPYTPGLHAFREGPVILKACSHLRTTPDLMLFAAHGIAHPRRFGLASHLGLILNIHAVGCARKILIGEHAEIGERKGSMAPLMIDGVQAGVVYRSRDGVKPIFISPGHRCRTADAAEIVISCLRDYRMPEPLRAAHISANRLKRAGGKRK
jgi:deoxyribonuclease V